MVYAIPIMAPLFINTKGSHRCFGVHLEPLHARLPGQPPDARQEGHGLPFLGGAHSGGNVDPVGFMPTWHEGGQLVP